MEEISGEQYTKFQAKLRREKFEIEQDLQKAGQQVSNLDLAVKNLFKHAKNLSVYWSYAAYYEKVQMHYWLLPEGISYSKKLTRVEP